MGRAPRVFLILLVGSICSHPGYAQDSESIETPVSEVIDPIPVAESSVATETPADEETKKPDTGYGMEAIRGANAILDNEAANVDPDGPRIDPSLVGTGYSDARNAFFRMIAALSVVVALILFCYYAIRRFGKKIPIIGGRQLGQVIGQLHLTRDATLHYVRTGGRVLVISVRSEGVNLIAEFSESAFDQELGQTVEHGGFAPEQFVAELKEQSAAYQAGASGDDSPVEDDDMAVLRGDIHRLQEYLQEETREPKE
ncbi:MAG: flagellar biosynthetic protein FliO [Candidatus Hydrogenedentota bacterium]